MHLHGGGGAEELLLFFDHLFLFIQTYSFLSVSAFHPFSSSYEMRRRGKWRGGTDTPMRSGRVSCLSCFDFHRQPSLSLLEQQEAVEACHHV